ncbi:MAG: zinc-binding dehydrogenase [Ginsengibacter sp.]
MNHQGSTLRNREISFKSALTKEIENHVWPLIEQGKFKPVIYTTFPLEDANKAHELMESSSHIGKIVLVVEQAVFCWDRSRPVLVVILKANCLFYSGILVLGELNRP